MAASACSSPSQRMTGKQSPLREQPAAKNMLDMMKNYKPPRVVEPAGSSMKAIKLTPREILKLVKGKQELMMIRDFNVRTISAGTRVVVVFGGSVTCEDDKASKPTKGCVKVWPVLGFVTFAGNVTLTEKNYTSHMELYGTMSSEPAPVSFDDFVEKSRTHCNKYQRIGWQFKNFTLHPSGLQLVPSTGGKEDQRAK